jgi:aminopeptidase N
VNNAQIWLVQTQDLAENIDYNVGMTYTGSLNDILIGFYRSSYENADGEEAFLATSHFQKPNARMAFPCLDEPDRKATFVITLGHVDDGKTGAISNMPVDRAYEGKDGYTMVQFEKTEIMSTYLLAFLVSDFVYTANVDDDSFKVWHTPGKIGQAEVAADAFPRILKHFEELWDLDYPLPKLDMAAIPDFGPGAMENWGLILYRETAVLYEEGVSSLADKENAVRIIAHELAHMWFGDIVTCDWWTDLWLNEGFASYVETIGTEVILPESEKINRMFLEHRLSAFAPDGLLSTKAISSPITNPYYSSPSFVVIYDKGSSLLKMIESYLTKDTFVQGINNYLKDHIYSTAERQDLWNALDAQGHNT